MTLGHPRSRRRRTCKCKRQSRCQLSCLADFRDSHERVSVTRVYDRMDLLPSKKQTSCRHASLRSCVCMCIKSLRRSIDFPQPVMTPSTTNCAHLTVEWSWWLCWLYCMHVLSTQGLFAFIKLCIYVSVSHVPAIIFVCKLVLYSVSILLCVRHWRVKLTLSCILM